MKAPLLCLLLSEVDSLLSGSVGKKASRTKSLGSHQVAWKKTTVCIAKYFPELQPKKIIAFFSVYRNSLETWLSQLSATRHPEGNSLFIPPWWYLVSCCQPLGQGAGVIFGSCSLTARPPSTQARFWSSQLKEREKSDLAQMAPPCWCRSLGIVFAASLVASSLLLEACTFSVAFVVVSIRQCGPSQRH